MAATNLKWAVLLTSFKTPGVRTRKPKAFFEDLFVKRVADGLHNYWIDQSGQSVNFDGSVVVDWTEMPFTLQKFLTDFGNNQRGTGVSAIATEFQKQKKIDLSSFFALIIITDEDVKDAGAGTATVIISGSSKRFPVTLANIDVMANANFLAHEMGHNLGLSHSNDMSNIPGNPVGEYMDAWDVLGGQGFDPITGQLRGGVFAFDHPTFQRVGPGISAPQMEIKSWLGKGSTTSTSQVLQIELGTNMMTDNDKRMFSIESLTRRKTTIQQGIFAVRIGYKDKITGEAMSYWVEARSKESWDKGIPEHTVLIRRQDSKGMIRVLVPDSDRPSVGWKAKQTFIDESKNLRISINQVYDWGADLIIEPFASNRKTVPQIQGSATAPICGAGIAMASIGSANQKDLVVLTIQDSNDDAGTGPKDPLKEKNKIAYRVGFKVDNEGNVAVNNPMLPNPTGWSALKNGPDIGHWEDQGADVAVGDINKSGRPDLLVAYIDNPGGLNQICYKVGWNLSVNGDVTGWSTQFTVPIKSETGATASVSFENSGCGVALADISGNSTLDLIVVYIENQQETNKAYYIIGWDLDSTGKAASWSERRLIPNFTNWENQGCGVAVEDMTGNGKSDLLFSYVDNPTGENKLHYIIGKELNKDGFPVAWSSPIALPVTIGKENQGAGVAVGKLAATAMPSLFALTVEQTTAAPAVSYTFLKSIEVRNDTK